MNLSDDSSGESEGELERLKEAVCAVKQTTRNTATSGGKSLATDKATTTSQLDISKDTQKFLAKKLSNYLDSLLVEVDKAGELEQYPEKPTENAGFGVKLLNRSTCSLLCQHNQVTTSKRKKPPTSPILSSESDEEEKRKLTEAAVNAQMIKKQRLT